MAETILLRPRRSFYLASVGHFKTRSTIIRADDPWFDKGGPLAGAREDFEPIRANTGGAIYGGPEPVNTPAEPAPVRRGPGRPKGSTAPAATTAPTKPKDTAAS